VTFEIGDKVIYPNHGLGTVERIESKTIMGTTAGFYQLRMANETTVFVPVDNVDGVGLRRAITDLEVQKLFELLSDGLIDSHQNWKGRFKDNSDRMRTGSIYDVVEVLKSLTFLAKSKSLSFREKRMLDRAKFLVVSEITEVLALKTLEVEDKVEKALETSFAVKAKNPGRPKPSVPARPVAPPVMAMPIPAPKPVAVAPPKPVPVVAPKPAAKPVAKTAAPAKPAARPQAVQARTTAQARANGSSRTSASRPAASRTPARPAAARAKAAARSSRNSSRRARAS